MASSPLTAALGELGSATAEAAAFAGGLAVGPILKPALQELENEVWQEAVALGVVRPLAAATAAEVAAEDVDKYASMETEAGYTGYDKTRFANLYGVSLNAPGEGTLLQLLRRTDEVSIDFEHGLRKAKFETQWDKALRNLRDLRIPGPDLAYMVVRGVVPDGGTLPSALPTQADRLALPPQLVLDTLKEAAKTGWDPGRFAALVARSGLAMAPVMAAQANFRGILTDNDYELTIARGDLFPAYADPVREVSRQILTSGEYVERQIRGFTDRTGRLADTAKHGMSDADSDKLYEVLGRGLAPHAITTGLARGGKYPGSYANIPEPYKATIQRANTREEFSELAYANRYTYPSGFMVKAETKDGNLKQPDTQELLHEMGWSPKWAKFFSDKWSAGGTVATDPNVKKAQTKAWTEAQSSYIAEEATAADVQPIFDLLAVDATAAQEIVGIWDAIRALTRKQLSPADIRKAEQQGDINAATGVAWTRADALAAMLARGWSETEANDYLNIPYKG